MPAPVSLDENSTHLLAAERKQRRAVQAEALAEHAVLQERLQRSETELQHRLLEKDEEIARLREQSSVKHASSVEFRAAARAREAELLEKNEALALDLRRLLQKAEGDAAELLAKDARCAARDVELAELQRALRTSEELRSGELRKLKDLQAELEQLRADHRELQMVERSGREHAQAQQERLNAQCEGLSRQAQDRGREADVLEESKRRLEESLKAKALEMDRALREAEERFRGTEAKLASAEAEAQASRDELKALHLLESKLQESVATLKAQVEDHKAQVLDLRKELFEEKRTSEEKDLVIEAAKRRAAQGADHAASLEERLKSALADATNSNAQLLEAKRQIEALKLERTGDHATLDSLKNEVVKGRTAAEEVRAETVKHFEARLAERDAESRQFQDQLAKQREVLCERSLALDQHTVDFAKQKGELAAIVGRREAELASRDEALGQVRAELLRAEETRHALQSELAQLRATLEEQRREAAAVLEAQAKQSSQALQEQQASAAAKETQLQEELAASIASNRAAAATLLVAEKEVMTSPRLSAASDAPCEADRWGADIAALSRSVVTLQAALSVAPAQRTDAEFEVTMNKAQTQTSCIVDEAPKLGFLARRLEQGRNRCVLREFFQAWQLHLRACAWCMEELDLAVADELRMAVRCKAVAEGCEDVLGERFPEPTHNALKRLVLEFRHRIVATLTELHSREPLAEALFASRSAAGRLLHAACFLYQKLRTLIPSELLASAEDPLCKMMPIPFYVLPYKARRAMERGVTAFARRAQRREQQKGAQHRDATDPEWLQGHIQDLEDGLPLSGSKSEVPLFVSQVLVAKQESEQIDSPGDGGNARQHAMVRLQDRMDVLLVDALTVYMSCWRSSGEAKGSRVAALAGGVFHPVTERPASRTTIQRKGREPVGPISEAPLQRGAPVRHPPPSASHR